MMVFMNRRPAEVFPPGAFLREEMEARGWTHGQTATALHVSRMILCSLIDGDERITPTYARRLSRALGTSPEVWLNLEAAYRASVRR
jgi:HTH-type transcriptional regulator/antitoxin HigA